MSIDSRSQSSSPDILGPPGDADYLVSSPIKPFAGRQSWLSPAVIKRQRTPAKRPRVSLSPAKSAHSIRFDDVLLPGSPTMKLDGRQRTLSPEKVTQEGNVSPWRIRVTLEATQDEENQGSPSPSRKRLRPSTVTTMIPLKDERSPLRDKTPAKRRGRPRKSDIQAQNGSPWPGSPGNTPGPVGATPKRGPGRPRKGTPKPKVQEIPVLEDEPTPTVDPAQQHFSPMDITADSSANPNRQWSPMNLATDGYESDSLGADDLPVADLRAPTPAHMETREDNMSHRYGRATYDTPIIGASEHHFLDNDENIHSTPSKMPSPIRERPGSSARSAHHASNIVSPRTYPTPTPTSSLAEEENQTGERTAEVHEDQQQPIEDQEPLTDLLADPTDEHNEFDSIMESEGFTMVSLDTLPSAKHYGLGSSAKMATDGSGTERENGRIGERLKRKLPGTIDDLRSDRQSSARPSPVTQGRSPRSRTVAPVNLEPQSANGKTTARVTYPELPVTRSPEKPLEDTPRRTPISLARVVRAGIALQGTFRPRENEVPGTGNANRKRRLEGVFSTFSPATQRELRAALGIGQELAMRQALAEAEQMRVLEEAETGKVPVDDHERHDDSMEEEQWDEQEEEESIVQSPPPEPMDSPRVNSSHFTRTRREEEWQLEREAVSRQAQDATNSQRLIYIESDDDVSQDDHRDAFDDRVQSDVESVVEELPLEEEPFDGEAFDEEHLDEEPEGFEPDLVHVPQPVAAHTTRMEEEFVDDDDDDDSVDIWRQETPNSEPEQEPEPLPANYQDVETEQEGFNDEDGFGDIWQQEARDHSHLSHHSEGRAQGVVQEPSSPWRAVASLSTNHSHLSSSPAYVTMEHRDGLHQEPTHIRKLREQDVDLSAILTKEDTPTRAHYYNGSSTPRSILSARSGAPLSSAMKSVSSTRKTGQRVRLQPISQSSPGIGSDAEFSNSPTFKPNASHPEPIEEEAEDIERVPYIAHETEPVYANSAAATPEPPRQSDQNVPASTWFQRITSLTPRWLKAPAEDDGDSSSSAPASEDEAEEDDQDDQERIASVESTREIHGRLDHAPLSNRSSESPSRYVEESASPQQVNGHGYVPSVEQDEDQVSVKDSDGVGEDVLQTHREGSATGRDADLIDDESVYMTNGNHPTLARPRPLPAFGYFSDEHYKALRRIYRMAKRSPERFPYYDSPGRAQIIGDWIWTSDGHHGVPITEAQFAIIDRFVHDLSRVDVEYGGNGQVDWTEADLHRRLISIIIGEQIREEQKARSARGVSVDTWR
ncbi:uncharacterized protein N7482_000475 [Penicillium canariense]|uniref:AT DNA binding protein n=1 Tax=Penicillium canariense TaxID=189055 RepID=A0A9W9IDF0_9EURO|nr:uncharacterized protein N7482_000475 [Penicillium canariense]KAJ5174598.1 hypothetical protein N7482_000475 [Penicillium canariense]